MGVVAKFWPILVGVVGLGGGVLFGWVKTKSAQTTKARAEASIAQARQQIEQGNAAASQAQTQAVEQAEDALQQAQAATSENIDQQLASLDELRKK
uniref:hypothetical protein n=1 Tax=Burkholderia diffusa TaxID=488732 RepID=UPI001CC4CF5A|nr:hypothetical protein [Burkholderia diffusa]